MHLIRAFVVAKVQNYRLKCSEDLMCLNVASSVSNVKWNINIFLFLNLCSSQNSFLLYVVFVLSANISVLAAIEGVPRGELEERSSCWKREAPDSATRLLNRVPLVPLIGAEAWQPLSPYMWSWWDADSHSLSTNEGKRKKRLDTSLYSGDKFFCCWFDNKLNSKFPCISVLNH